MAPPSKLSIATSSVNRLVKEEVSYHKELQQQEQSIKKLEDAQGDEYQIKQEKRALEETKVMIPNVRNQIANAVAKLEQELEAAQEASNGSSDEEITKAKEAISGAKTSLMEHA